MRPMRSRIIAGFVVGFLLLTSGMLVMGCGDDPAGEVLEVLETISVKTFSKTFGGAGRDEANSVQQTTDGGYILAGSTSSFGSGGDAYLVKTDSSGNMVWQKNFGGAGGDSANSVQQTSDGGYIFAGYYSDDTVEMDDPYTQPYLFKTGASGNLVWQKVLDGDMCYATSVQQASDGGYILAGSVTRQSKPASNRHLKTGHLRFNNNLLLRVLLVTINVEPPALALM